jgi:hypothetical protein
MNVKYLISSSQRSNGAMFAKSLKEELLVFLYPTETAHIFHTFFCPPVRMVALNQKGKPIFDKVMQPNRFVRLPKSKIILEGATDMEYLSYVEQILSKANDHRFQQSGALEPGSRIDSLLFALFAQAMADLRRVREASGNEVQRDILRTKFNLWERGRFASSAGFITDFYDLYNLPESAVSLSQDLIRVESPYLDELFAASIGSMPWRQVFPGVCLRCGASARWKTALSAPLDTPPEIAWRYQRPENAVPLCRACTMTTEFLKKLDLRIDLAWGLWGPRFEALWKWHQMFPQGKLPNWDKLAHPLWPEEYGGTTWETGSGALEYATPRPPNGVARTTRHDEIFWRGLSTKDTRKRGLTDAYLQVMLSPAVESELL